MPRDSITDAATTVRGSAPSGSTIRFTSARAASMSRWRKAGGERRGSRLEPLKLRSHSGSIRSATKFMVRSTRSRSSDGISGLRVLTRVAAP